MTQPPPTPAPDPWAEYPEVDPQGNPVAVSRTEDPWSDYPEAAETPSLASPNQPVPGHPAERIASGMVRSGLSAINPINVAKAAWELGKLGVRAAVSPTSPEVTGGVRDIGRGVYETGAALFGQRGPEAFGEAAGGVLAGALPAGRASAATARGLGATEASRAYNVKRALRVPAGSVVARNVEAMAPEIDMGVHLTNRGLARSMTVARKAAGEAVGAAEERLPVRDVPVARVAQRISTPPGQQVARTIETPEQIIDTGILNEFGQPVRRVEPVARSTRIEFVPDDPAMMSAHRASLRRLEEAGGPAGVVQTPDAVRMKRSAQGAADRGRAYTSERAGLQAKAAEARGGALREELESLPGSEEFTTANRRFSVAATAEDPVVAEAARLSDLPLAGRGVEMLLGRAIPGSGFARQALGGLAGGQLLDSTLFHTANAAVKRRVIDAVQSGNLQLATDILFKSAVAEHTTRRRAAAALAAQGEGVTTP